VPEGDVRGHAERRQGWTWALLAACAKTYAIVILCSFFHLI